MALCCCCCCCCCQTHKSRLPWWLLLKMVFCNNIRSSSFHSIQYPSIFTSQITIIFLSVFHVEHFAEWASAHASQAHLFPQSENGNVIITNMNGVNLYSSSELNAIASANGDYTTIYVINTNVLCSACLWNFGAHAYRIRKILGNAQIRLSEAIELALPYLLCVFVWVQCSGKPVSAEERYTVEESERM